MADDVQPESGQGDATGDSPFQEYLDRIPEEARDAAEEAFKAFDANTTRKFQEASEYRKGWEPFEQLGVNHRDPEEVAWSLQMLDAVQNNPAAVQEWFQTYAQEQGLTAAQAAQQIADSDEYVDPSVQQLVQQQLAAQNGPIAEQLRELAEWRDSQDQERQEQHLLSEIESELATLEKKHPDDFNREMVDKFVASHMNEEDPREAVRAAFSDWQAVKSQIEKETLNGKVSQPPAAVSGGNADVDTSQAKTWKDAKAQALEHIRAANRS